jgi:hypothetical protein
MARGVKGISLAKAHFPDSYSYVRIILYVIHVPSLLLTCILWRIV